MVPAKEFREDLYYRLNVVRIKMPPLRERADDIPQIVDFCLQNLVKQRKTRVSKVSPETIDVLRRHRWHGNVRELENVIYRSAVIAQGDAILPKDLPVEIRAAVGPLTASPIAETAAPVLAPDAPEVATPAAAAVLPTPVTTTSAPSSISLVAPENRDGLTLERVFDFLQETLPDGEEPILARIEREMVIRVLAAFDGNQAKAAERLGMTRTTLRKRIETYGLKE